MRKWTNAIVLSGFFALALVGFAVARQLDDALAAYQRGDYTTALAIWRPLADQGDAVAQNNIGAMYAHGQGVPLIVADGYHRICAICYYDESAPIACRMASM
jgi:TPR repeat protein